MRHGSDRPRWREDRSRADVACSGKYVTVDMYIICRYSQNLPLSFCILTKVKSLLTIVCTCSMNREANAGVYNAERISLLTVKYNLMHILVPIAVPKNVYMCNTPHY